MKLEEAQSIFNHWCNSVTASTSHLSKESIKERKQVALNLLAENLRPQDAYYFRLYNTAQTRPNQSN
jgi:hypothetical protein